MKFTDDKELEREINLRLAHGYLGLAAKHLYIAESYDELIDVHTIMDIVQYDHAELVKTKFPIVEKRNK